MKKIISVVIYLAFTTQVFTQNDASIKVFNDQLDAFNQRDIERLTDNIHENFKWFYITPDTVLLEVAGKENFRKSMENYYKYFPGVTSEIVQKVINGNRISFEEIVTWEGKKGRQSQSCIGVYEMKTGKIYRAWYFID